MISVCGSEGNVSALRRLRDFYLIQMDLVVRWRPGPRAFRIRPRWNSGSSGPSCFSPS